MNIHKTVPLLLLVVLLSVLQLSDCGLTDWSDCSAKNDIIVKIVDFKLSSGTYQRGDMLVGNVTYELKQDLPGILTLSAYGKHGPVPYFEDTLNLCEKKIVTCPVKTGKGNVVFKYKLAEFQPMGSYEVHFLVTDDRGNEVICLDFNIRVKY